MPRSLGPIPLGTPIVDRDGTITPFFRQRWQDVGEGWTQTPTVQRFTRLAQTASLPLTTLATVTRPGLYRVSWFLRTTRVDGVSSSVTVGLGVVDLDGVALGFTDRPMTFDDVRGWQSATQLFRCQAPSDLLMVATYASATPGQMRYDLEMTVEFLP